VKGVSLTGKVEDESFCRCVSNECTVYGRQVVDIKFDTSELSRKKNRTQTTKFGFWDM